LEKAIDVGVVERAHHDRQRVSLQRVSEGGDFPGSEVSGEKQNSFAASVGAFEVFKAIVDHGARNVFTGVTREEAHFGELASEGNEFAANQAAALVLRHFGKGEGQVADADATQASVNRVDGQSQRDSDGARHG